MIKALLNEHYIGSTPTWSELEEAFLALCRADDLPQPEVNRWITLPDGGPAIRADFLFRNERIVVETDSHRFHKHRPSVRTRPRPRPTPHRLRLATLPHDLAPSHAPRPVVGARLRAMIRQAA